MHAPPRPTHRSAAPGECRAPTRRAGARAALGLAALLAAGCARDATPAVRGPAANSARGAIAAPVAPRPVARRPVATYSIVARDPRTGALGVAVQSHWFSVGPVVPWAQAGVGAVATQSFVKISYGPEGLSRMAAGDAPADALAALLAEDDGRDVRQVAMIDAQGRVAAHTGSRCIAEAGHATGADYSVQANLMERDTVWPAMAAAFERSEGPLAERMLAALLAAEGEGGDIRGRQSAALLVVSGTPTGRAWDDRTVDLRVEDHPDPLGELARLLRLHRAYEHMNAGDVHMEHADMDAAVAAYGDALALAPDVYEIAFWSGITLAANGRETEALPLLGRAYAGEPRLRQLVRRLPASGLLPDDDALIARLVAAEADEGR
ncbi:MAG: DUF1028 domain-containing protein [Planctomycetota bacterium]|jgi:uncharacterized Ntn-hydrolase superfamily protein